MRTIKIAKFADEYYLNILNELRKRLVELITPTINNKDGTVNGKDHNYNQGIRDSLKILDKLIKSLSTKKSSNNDFKAHKSSPKVCYNVRCGGWIPNNTCSTEWFKEGCKDR